VVNKNHARHFVGVSPSVDARYQSTERMPNEHIRPLDSGVFQCGVYLADPK